MHVRDFHVPGKVSWEEARAQAFIALAGTTGAGSDGAIKKSYDKVARDLRQRRGGKYFILKDKRYRSLIWNEEYAPRPRVKRKRRKLP
jgi:hypothetical protein